MPRRHRILLANLSIAALNVQLPAPSVMEVAARRVNGLTLSAMAGANPRGTRPIIPVR